MEGNESWYICCEKIVGLFRQAPQNLFKRFVHTFFFQQQVLLGGRLQMVRKLEPSWHHLSGSGYLVPWTLGVLNGIAAWLKWTEPLSPSGGDAYFVSAKGCDQQGDWGGKIYTKQVSEDPTIHDQVFKSHFSRLRGDTIIRRCNPPIRSSMNTSTHMDDETQSLGHKPLHCSNLARCLLWPPPSSSLSSSSSSFSSSQVSGGFLARTTSVEEVTHIRRHLLDHIAANICEHFL